MVIIDGKYVSDVIKEDIKQDIIENKLNPSLTVIQVGDNESSNIYIKNKEKACLKVGIKFNLLKYLTITEDELIENIKKLNSDKNVNGIIVQLPLPESFNTNKILNVINPIKDVDGLTSINVGNLVLGNDALVSCTPLGIIKLLKYYNINLEGKKVTIIGRSNLVGKPLISLLLKENASVSVCHSKTLNIKDYTLDSDVIIVAVGKPKFLKEDYVKENAIIIDVGINKIDNKICGDVDFELVSQKSSYITPVPKGVGPMTIAMLLNNVVKAYRMQNEN